jgi:hypothetical protein
MTSASPPDPLNPGQLAEAILAVERRVAVLEKGKLRISGTRVLIMFVVAIALVITAFFWQPFESKNYQQCAENAAREAKTNPALGILLSSCRNKFGKK